MLKPAGAIRIPSGKFGAMDTERGHERVARIKNAGLPVREWTPFGATISGIRAVVKDVAPSHTS